MPVQSDPWKGSPAPAKPAKPASPSADELQELPTLTPLEPTPGLTPLGPATGGLTPLGADPLGGGLPALGDDPFAGLPAANVSGRTLGPVAIPNPLGPATAPGGFGAPAHNPYASPAGGGCSAGYSGVSDAGRKGLPWERGPDMESFQDTAMLILGEPTNAFMQMRRSGGLMNSLAFWVVAAIIAQVANAVYSTILNGIILAVGNAPGEAYAGLAIGAAIYLVGSIIGTLMFAPVGAFLGSAIWHVELLVFGCARGGFEATFRAWCFASGGVILLNIIPIVGPLIGFFYGIAVMIHAFSHAHEVSGGRVTAAVLTLYALLCCCLSPLVFLVVMPLLAQIARGGPL